MQPGHRPGWRRSKERSGSYSKVSEHHRWQLKNRFGRSPLAYCSRRWWKSLYEIHWRPSPQEGWRWWERQAVRYRSELRCRSYRLMRLGQPRCKEWYCMPRNKMGFFGGGVSDLRDWFFGGWEIWWALAWLTLWGLVTLGVEQRSWW